MGMGFGANYADVMEWPQIKKIVPKEARALERALKKAGASLDDFCKVVVCEDWDSLDTDVTDPKIAETIPRIQSAWETLSKAFTEATTVNGTGLELEPRFHNSDSEGDRYDDVSGGFFHVEGMHQLTPAGKKLADKIERKFYVTFG
jgi:hypothetical protein